MTTTTRTDIHAPASPDFDPQAYDFLGVWDLHETDGNRADLIRLLARLESKGITRARYSGRVATQGTCTHCGARLRYTAVMIHMLMSEYLFVGETCLDHRFTVSQAAFRAAREAGIANRERRTRSERLAAFVADRSEPIVAILAASTGEANDPIVDESGFLCDLSARLRRDCELTDRQIAAAQRAYDRDSERAAARAKAAAMRAQMPAEYLGEVGASVIVAGEVVLAMTVDGYMPDTSQRLIIVQTDRGAAKVYTTAKWSWDVEKGQQIALTATVKRHDTYEDRPQTLITRARLAK